MEEAKLEECRESDAEPAARASDHPFEISSGSPTPNVQQQAPSPGSKAEPVRQGLPPPPLANGENDSSEQPGADLVKSASQDGMSASDGGEEMQRVPSRQEVIHDHVQFAVSTISNDVRVRRTSFEAAEGSPAQPELHTHAFYTKKWSEAIWYAEQKTSKNAYSYANTKKMNEGELKQHQNKIKNNLRLQNFMEATNKNDELVQSFGREANSNGTTMDSGSPLVRGVPAQGAEGGESMISVGAASQASTVQTPSKFKSALLKFGDSQVMIRILAICALFITFAEDLAAIINPSWARNQVILILQLLCFIVIAAENLGRWVMSSSYWRRTAFRAFVVLACAYLFEILWVLGRVDLLSVVGFDAKHSNLGWRIISWSIRLSSCIFLALRYGAQQYLLIREMEESARTSYTAQTVDDGLHLGSILGTRLQYLIYRDVVVTVGALLFLAPCIATATQPNRFEGVRADLEIMIKLHHHTLADVAGIPTYRRAVDGFVQSKSKHKASEGMSVLLITMDKEIIHGKPQEKVHPLQHVLVNHMLEIEGSSHTIEVLFNDIDGVRLDALGHIASLLICGVLVAIFTRALMTSLTEDIVEPMENLMDLITQLSFQPMRPLVSKYDKNSTKFKSLGRSDYVIVEAGLQRIGSLLQMGFGEAGAQIIKDLMQSGNLNYNNLPGLVTKGIFGFCDIRNFTDLTEVLQSDVCKVVNQVAGYVHEAVVDNFGSPNKNIGDAFLMAWKPKEGLRLETEADAALRSIVRTIIEISRSEALHFWATHPDIQKRLPGFRIKLGFGLHYGWAIECAIGSKRKLEASYLSPHVNMASRLESATKMFGAEILISHQSYNLFSEKVQGYCRLIDRVTLKGSEKPMSLYTYDVPKLQKCGGNLVDDINIQDKEMSNSDFFEMAKPVLTTEFRSSFDEAVKNYLGAKDGVGADWVKAKEHITRCLEISPGDGPSENILSVLSSLAAPDGSAPTSWVGYRKLTEK